MSNHTLSHNINFNFDSIYFPHFMVISSFGHLRFMPDSNDIEQHMDIAYRTACVQLKTILDLMCIHVLDAYVLHCVLFLVFQVSGLYFFL